MSIIRAFDKAFEKKRERGWDTIYVFVDIHETILYPTYEINGEMEFYPYALDALLALSSRDDIVLGLYTCSYPDEIKQYLKFFQEKGIDFKCVNTNPFEKNSTWGFFNQKPYFNVLIEDKAGFDAENDWHPILRYLKLEKWKQNIHA